MNKVAHDNTPSLAAELFREIRLEGNSAKDIYSKLKCYGFQRLKYMGEEGCDPGYIFRGELDYDDPLLTRIERKVREQLAENSGSFALIRNEEKRIVEVEVGRNNSRIQKMRPAKVTNEDVFWWLSAIQHYGGDTRLLDFTRDIEVALFFALEHQTKSKNKDRDLMVYCFPCKDVENGGVTTLGNKSPIAPSEAGIDLNRALGCLIGLSWMEKHRRNEARSRQQFGWDRAYYPNDRLSRQKGMFVYPFDYPQVVARQGTSWLTQNICALKHDRFNMQSRQGATPPLRLRIANVWAKQLAKLNMHAGYTQTSIYGTDPSCNSHGVCLLRAVK